MNIRQKYKDKSLVFKLVFPLTLSIVLISTIAIYVLYTMQLNQAEQNIVKEGNSILNNYISNSRDSIAKGQRKTFQEIMNNVKQIEGVEHTYLFARNHLMNYKDGEVTVGKVFVHKDNQFVNPNLELYEKTNGMHLREDWSIKDTLSENSPNAQNHIDEQSRKLGINANSCVDCHYRMDEDLTFNAEGKAFKLDGNLSHFYYSIPVEKDCISCHTNWKVGESSGYIGLTMENTEVIEQVKGHLQGFIIVILIIVVAIIIVVFFVARYLKGSLSSLQDGILNLKDGKSAKVNISSKDEIGEIAFLLNEYISNIQDGIKEDEKLIDEAKDVMSKAKVGVYNQSIKSTTSNRSLEEFKNNVNDMILVTKEHFEDMNSILKQYSNYDYRDILSLDNIEKDGTLELLINNINHLRNAITSMLIENKKDGKMLSDSSDKLLNDVTILSKSSNEAAASLEETASALEEMTSNISYNTKNVLEMTNYAHQLSDSANEGEKLASNTTMAMEKINEQVASINEAITVIDQIAFQTNILSLNAAVEAATAGEAGKGFAVVAQEVRNLASRSAEAAKDIKELVASATSMANEGKDIANKMIDGYHTLNDNIVKTLKLIENVESASKEQQNGISQINNAIHNLDKQTQENANVASQVQDIANNTSVIAAKIVENTNQKEFDGKDSV